MRWPQPSPRSPLRRRPGATDCGRTLDPDILLDPRSKIIGAVPQKRAITHFFLRLSALADDLLAWLETNAWNCGRHCAPPWTSPVR
ncbi:class I tRNA ligase family protein [Frankia sp. Cr2]|uniref:class I tRNA ligase family protein n=1 Tax=Frankia sp. Cr2 TaxID=3073932 RepID=UPI003A101962